jgi:hypothetical protein
MKSTVAIKALAFIFCCLLAVQEAYAQRDLAADTAELQIIYSHERMGTIIAHSFGMGAGYRWGTNATAFRTRVISAEFVSFRSPKQIKTINPYYNNAKRYVYGKMNDVFFLRAGIANKQLINRKPLWGGVEVRWLYEGGATLGIEKPYYLFVISFYQGIGDNLSYSIETKRFDPAFLSWDDIYGRAPFTRGIGEISLKPGVYIKSGFNFEFGEVRTRMQAFEAGFVLELFPQGVTIMADDENNKLFWSFYISMSLGSRFNKF